MARIQILELPAGAGDDRPSFVLVVDQANYDSLSSLSAALEGWQNIKDQIGARAVLVFEETIEIPANSVIAGGPVEARVYVGEREVGGAVAIRAHADSERKAAITDALGMDRLRDWGDIRNAAAGLRRSRDSMRDAIQRVREMPEQPEVMDAQHPHPDAYLHGYGVAIRAATRATQEPERSRGADG